MKLKESLVWKKLSKPSIKVIHREIPLSASTRQTFARLAVRATEEGGGGLPAEGGGAGQPGAGADGGEGEPEESPEWWGHPGPHYPT